MCRELHIAYRYGDHYDSVRRIGDNSESRGRLRIQVYIGRWDLSVRLIWHTQTQRAHIASLIHSLASVFFPSLSLDALLHQSPSVLALNPDTCFLAGDSRLSEEMSLCVLAISSETLTFRILSTRGDYTQPPSCEVFRILNIIEGVKTVWRQQYGADVVLLLLLAELAVEIRGWSERQTRKTFTNIPRIRQCDTSLHREPRNAGSERLCLSRWLQRTFANDGQPLRRRKMREILSKHFWWSLFYNTRKISVFFSWWGEPVPPECSRHKLVGAHVNTEDSSVCFSKHLGTKSLQTKKMWCAKLRSTQPFQLRSN